MMKITSGTPFLISPPAQPLIDAPHATDRPMAISNSGSDSTMSIVREMKVSILPPRNPASRPRVIPITSEMPVPMNETSNDVLAPYIVRTKTSRPIPSTPNHAFFDGPTFGMPMESVKF